MKTDRSAKNSIQWNMWGGWDYVLCQIMSGVELKG